MPQKSHKPPISCKTILVILLAFIGGGLLAAIAMPLAMPIIKQIREERRARLEGPFVNQMAAYTARFATAPASARTQKLQGKILVINPATKTVDDLFHELPRERQAQTPEEVGVLAWLDCHPLGTYTYVGAIVIAQQEYCKITLIDWQTRRIVQEREFTGNPPPERIEVDQYGVPINSKEIDTLVHREVLLDWLYSQIE